MANLAIPKYFGNIPIAFGFDFRVFVFSVSLTNVMICSDSFNHIDSSTVKIGRSTVKHEELEC